MITDTPSPDNNRCFMIYDGAPTYDSFLFDGNYAQFADCFFSIKDWDAIVQWAKDQEYVLVMDGTLLYADLAAMLNEADDADPENYPEDGLYDAGGHPIEERWADYADVLNDRFKYGE